MSLGGCIEVNSEKGVGTTITIMVLKTRNIG
jgi:chemotaxis protein histidine kinase CheA